MTKSSLRAKRSRHFFFLAEGLLGTVLHDEVLPAGEAKPPFLFLLLALHMASEVVEDCLPSGTLHLRRVFAFSIED